MNEDETREQLLSLSIKQKGQMARLLETEGWQTYSNLVQTQIDTRIFELLSEPNSSDDVVKKTYNTGVLAGLKMAQAYPKILMDMMQENINVEKFREEQENGNGERNEAEPEFGWDVAGDEGDWTSGDAR